MRKRDELVSGCMAKARDDEMTFVLLARDEDAPGTIRDWIARRIASGKNRLGDAKLVEAEECARIMESEPIGMKWIKWKREGSRKTLSHAVRPAGDRTFCGIQLPEHVREVDEPSERAACRVCWNATKVREKAETEHMG